MRIGIDNFMGIRVKCVHSRFLFFTPFLFIAQMDLISRLLIRVYSERIEAQNISFH